jgi:integrase
MGAPMFRKGLLRAGLPPIRFPDLRHGTATLPLAQGVDLKTILTILGHSQISITADLYAHVGECLKRQVEDKMQALFGGRGPGVFPVRGILLACLDSE